MPPATDGVSGSNRIRSLRSARSTTCSSANGSRRFERDVRQDRAVTTEPGRAASAEPRPPRGPARRWLRARPADVIDLFVYVVVLNLAIEYVPSVISEGFTLSPLTALLLKIALELVIVLKNKVIGRLRAATTRRAAAAALSLWVVAAGSKLVVLELVDLVFGDAVSLGGFIPVTLLVVALLGSRAAVRRSSSMTLRRRPDQSHFRESSSSVRGVRHDELTPTSSGAHRWSLSRHR